ncbi:MAG: hypothetical protein ACM3XM_13975, partial [Mycobacterium leprae]
ARLPALIAVAAVVVGCVQAKPAPPVQAPVVDTKSAILSTPSAAPDMQPTTQVQPETPMQTPAPAPAPTPAAMPPAFLQAIIASGWKLSALEHLPPRERPVGAQQSWEWVYEGGALRLYPDRPDSDSLLVLVVDHTKPAYQEFKDLVSSERFVAAHDGNYTAVLRIAPVSQATRAELAAKEWTADELQARLGGPTSRVHNHGVGNYTVTYVPQGLEFVEDTTLRLGKATAEQIWRQESESRASWPSYVDQILKKGRPSPDGKFVAAYFKGGGYWSQSILVRAEGKSEVEYHANYFIQDYFWLDNRRLVYRESDVNTFCVIDVVAEKTLEPISVPGQVKAFGPNGNGGLWYADQDGVRHEVKVP